MKNGKHKMNGHMMSDAEMKKNMSYKAKKQKKSKKGKKKNKKRR